VPYKQDLIYELWLLPTRNTSRVSLIFRSIEKQNWALRRLFMVERLESRARATIESGVEKTLACIQVVRPQGCRWIQSGVWPPTDWPAERKAALGVQSQRPAQDKTHYLMMCAAHFAFKAHALEFQTSFVTSHVCAATVSYEYNSQRAESFQLVLNCMRASFAYYLGPFAGADSAHTTGKSI
jgi:hypothetical protein